MQLFQGKLRLTNKYRIIKKNMKTLTTFIATALLAFCTTACSQQHTYRSGSFGSKTVKASKNYVTKDIKVDNFTKLSVAGSPDVTYTQKSGKPTVEVYTSDNIVDLLDIRVKDNTLYVGFKKNVKRIIRQTESPCLRRKAERYCRGRFRRRGIEKRAKNGRP